MNDFLIHELAWYPWLAPVLLVLAGAGLGYLAVWAYKVQLAAFAWLGYRRAVWHWKAAVRRVGDGGDHLCPMHALEAEKVTGTDHLLEDDPPEYQHPDGDDDLLPEPDLDAVVAFLDAVRKMGLLDEGERPDDLDYCEHGVIRRTCTRCNPGRLGPPVCEDIECQNYGWVHPPPCVMVETLPVPKYPWPVNATGANQPCPRCWSTLGLCPPEHWRARFLDGPAMPPQPVREFLHPAIMDDLEAAGFSEHETTEGAVDSMFTRAQVREVQAMITDGVVIPTDETGRSHGTG